MEEIEIDLKHLGNEVLLFSIVFLVFLFLSLFFSPPLFNRMGIVAIQVLVIFKITRWMSV